MIRGERGQIDRLIHCDASRARDEITPNEGA
jgi:hypothetical protein